jgi:hypothetical protein
MNYLTRFLDKWRKSSAMPACLITLLILTTAISPPLWAADCTPSSIGLYTQADIDSFQANHGPCDRALTIYIEGADISNLDGLSALTNVGDTLAILDNQALSNVNGLSGLTYVGSALDVQYNDILDQCAGLSHLVDQWDDAEPGPGPGDSGVPDVGGEVLLGENLAGCNSIEEILAGVDISKINAGLNDAWYYPETDGQGFFITIFPQ